MQFWHLTLQFKNIKKKSKKEGHGKLEVLIKSSVSFYFSTLFSPSNIFAIFNGF